MAYFDGMLTSLARYRVNRHLRNCASCRQELAEIERIGKELHNMAHDLSSADGDTLDPILRARILAAIPAVPAQPPARSRMPIQFWQRIALGALATVGVAAAIILPQRQVRQKALLYSRPAWAQDPLRDEGSSPTASSSAKALNKSASVAAPEPRAAKIDHVASLSSGAMRSQEKRADRAGQDFEQTMASTAPAAGGTSYYVQEKKSAGGTGGVGGTGGTGRISIRDSSAASSSHGERHTFTTNNLAEGEKLVKQAVAAYNGSVAGQSRSVGLNTLELTVIVPTSQSAPFLAVIPTMTHGALRPRTWLGKAKHVTNGSSMGGRDTRVAAHSKPNSKLDGKLIQSADVNGMNGSAAPQTLTPRTATQPTGGGLNDKSKVQKQPSMASRAATATTTITIVLIKGG